MGALFGTDGIRGLANEDLSCELVMKIGRATAKVLTQRSGHKPKFLIGTDTRLSGNMLAGAFAAGVCSMGADVELLGIIPTPAVAYLVKRYGADAGVVISASHNPAEYNGIKVFGNNGIKIPDEYESEIEALALGSLPILSDRRGDEVGHVIAVEKAVEDYVGFVAQTCGTTLGGIKVLADCANGSASVTAGKIFHTLGADVTIINDTPDGVNINRGCGSMHIEALGDAVRRGNFDLGVAFDGDADRLLLTDSAGNELDGDYIMAILGRDMKARGRLTNHVIVGTVMTNLGLIRSCEAEGIQVVATKVGDRFVLEEMLAKDYALGGEQSGHIIIRDLHTTGDGQMAAVQILKIMKETGKSIEELAGVMEKYPQVMKNITVTAQEKQMLQEDEGIRSQIRLWEEKLGNNGRILVRPSGTEPYVRVMSEGKDLEQVSACVEAICEAIKERIG